MAERIRLATINTWKADGDYPKRLTALECALGEIDADIIALQEAFVVESEGIDTAAHLAGAHGYCYAHEHARQKLREHHGRIVDSSSGLAVLSRWPIVDRVRIELPWDVTDGDRIALGCAIETPLGLVRFVCVHLTHLNSLAGLRDLQLQVILATPWLALPAAGKFLAGDFNAKPDAMKAMLAGCRVVDGYLAGGGAEPRDTLTTTTGGTQYPRCIDYILGLAVGCAVPCFDDAALFGTERVGGVFPSDHYGVTVRAGVPTPKR
jgi:endonuclease/exonuclease/phosphatase family metal-dependent hydrolase